MAVAAKNSNTAFLPGSTNSKEDKIRSAEQSTAKRVGRVHSQATEITAELPLL
jgi:hypothetical protein